MTTEERVNAATAKMEELKAKLDEANEAVKDSFRQGAANFKSDMEFTAASIDEIADDAERKHDLRVEKTIDSIIAADEKIEAKREERLEKRKAKIEAARDRINELAQEVSKADQEQLIIDLLDYADDCQATAVYMAGEAALAYKAAARELADYYSKYGE